MTVYLIELAIGNITASSALFYLVWTDKTFREGKKEALAAWLLSITVLIPALAFSSAETAWLEYMSYALMIGSLFLMIHLAIKTYGREFLLRDKHILRHFVRNIRDTPEPPMQSRLSFECPLRNLSDTTKRMIMEEGCSIVLVGEPLTKEVMRETVLQMVIDGLINGETIDYVCTDTPPYRILDQLQIILAQRKLDVSKLPACDFMIIDAYTPTSGYGDDIYKYRSSVYRDVNIIKAASFPAIHSATMDTWDLRKEHQRKDEKKSRKPHRMIYDSLSSLVENGDAHAENQLAKYYRHVLMSEKGFRMITIIVENIAISGQLTDLLQDQAEFFFEFKIDDKGTPRSDCIKALS